MKTNEQRQADISAARQKRDASKLHPYAGLLTSTRDLFAILQSDFQWSQDDINEFYPEQTVDQAKREGWQPATA